MLRYKFTRNIKLNIYIYINIYIYNITKNYILTYINFILIYYSLSCEWRELL